MADSQALPQLHIYLSGSLRPDSMGAWWNVLLEAAEGKAVPPNLVREAKAVGSERSPGRIDGLLEASEWRAAKEAYGPWHLKSLRAALRLGELLEAPRAEALLRHAAAGLEATLGLHVDTLRATN
ncbi:unnamed protein product [Effrenium voratum]|nr:unnamed protein product [Effrenium voratum]CAJ1455050.1 unnamed protein product [Effrenium voratum]